MERAPGRPTEVSIGISVFALSVGASFLELAMNVLGIGYVAPPPLGFGLSFAAWFSMEFYVIWLAWEGRNWARIVTVVFAAMALTALPVAFENMSASGFHPLLVLSNGTAALTPVGIIAVFLPRANGWFKMMKARRSAGEMSV